MSTNRRPTAHVNAVVALGLAIGVLAAPATPRAQTVAAGETRLRIERALERLPYYGVFDLLAFRVDRGIVTLSGFAYSATTKSEAAKVVKQVAGVDEVANKIELLPTSDFDERIRWATFYLIYTDDFLSRYAPGGAMRARYEVANFARFPGMQPFGTYPIHIIVKNRKTTLVGVVDNESDKTLAGVRARDVASVAGVENELLIKGK
jgi:osmotically-inducible protein OsmY